MSVVELPAAPSAMEQLSYGFFQGTIDEGPPPPRFPFASLRRKHWIYVGVYDPRFVFGLGLVDIGYASNAFSYLGVLSPEDSALASIPLAQRFWKRVTPANMVLVERWRASWGFGGENASILLPGTVCPGSVRGKLALPDKSVASFELSLRKTNPSVTSPVTCVAPMEAPEAGRWNLTTKDNTLRAEGILQWNDREFRIEAPACFDVTDGYPPRHTRWNWASFAGKATDGRSIGVNLCALHNDTEHARENVLWIDSRPFSLGAVQFRFDENATATQPWTIFGDGVDLRFEPSGERDGRENLLLVRSSFVQPYGRFYGTIRVAEQTVTVDGVVGVVENHSALW